MKLLVAACIGLVIGWFVLIRIGQSLLGADSYYKMSKHLAGKFGR